MLSPQSSNFYNPNPCTVCVEGGKSEEEEEEEGKVVKLTNIKEYDVWGNI